MFFSHVKNLPKQTATHQTHFSQVTRCIFPEEDDAVLKLGALVFCIWRLPPPNPQDAKSASQNEGCEVGIFPSKNGGFAVILVVTGILGGGYRSKSCVTTWLIDIDMFIPGGLLPIFGKETPKV